MNYFYLVLISILFIIIGYLFGNILFGEIIAKIKKNDVRNFGSGNIGSTNVARTIGIKAGIITFICDSFKTWLAIFVSYLFLILIIENSLIKDQAFFKANSFIIYLSGLFTIIGHCFPIKYFYYLHKTNFNHQEMKKYSGGKGAASTAGLLLSLSPWIFLICLLTWIIVVVITKYVSLASLLGIFMSIILVLIPNLDYFYLLGIKIGDNAVININDISDNFINPFFNYNQNWSFIIFNLFILIFAFIIVIYKHKENIKRLLQKNENKIYKKTK